MQRIEIKGPGEMRRPFNMGDNAQELGDTPQGIVNKLNRMMTEIYAAVAAVQEAVNTIEATPGEQGPQGVPGIQGEAGPRGIQGEPGAQGAQGIPGVAGAQGQQGQQGVAGAAGAPGYVNAGSVTIGQTAIIAIALGIREVTVTLTGAIRGARYNAYATSYKLNGGASVSGRPSGYSIVDCVSNLNDQITISLNAPLLAIGQSYEITCSIARLP